ncbi:MAG: glucose-6-phosphate isomerase, partial [Burkholderiales bacterium]
MIRCDRTPAWAALQAAFDAGANRFDLRSAFAMDAQRFDRFSQSAPHVFADLSKNLLDADVEALLLNLARQCGVQEHRDAMLAGDAINTTEQRAAMHWLLRYPPLAPENTAQAATKNVAVELVAVHATLGAVLAYAQTVRDDAAITDVVNIGIGGSDLGPQMAVLALDAFATTGKRFHFVSNVDGHELDATLRRLKPESTLFLIASKTFTTIETMTNAHSAKAWFTAQGG